MPYAIHMWPHPIVPVADTDLEFPVGRIFCVGRNYAAHAREMGSDPEAEPPVFFCKTATCLLPGGGRLPYPPATDDLQPEIELVVALGRGGRDIEPREALESVYGYAVGLDMTRRDLQRLAKERRQPWDMSKSFDHAAPCSPVVCAAKSGHPDRGAIELRVGGEVRQRADLRDMIWSVPHVIAHLSRLITLTPGDLIFTGTPAGVAPVVPGDLLEGRIEAVGSIRLTIG